MADAPKPTYVAELGIHFTSSRIILYFRSWEGAISTKENLTAAIESGRSSFDIELDVARTIIFQLNTIQAITITDLIIDSEIRLKNIPWQKYQEKLFADTNKNTEEILEETSFGIGR